ncbi:MAG: hypothetical protein JST43_13590 [Bacteroidetes bacterium]|nr:hypothetical protein [Bacteroidota bacterium]MBS1539792.1 hypothetical protein [Bacteroidota bacterium]
MCRIWLTMSPKTIPGLDYAQLFPNSTRSTPDRKRLLDSEFVQWHDRHKDFINEKSYQLTTGRYWYKHKLVWRSFMVIRKALTQMFHYLDNHRVPKSTNGLESFFGHLKGHLAVHRGLSNKHRKNFMQWYLFFKNASRSEFS